MAKSLDTARCWGIEADDSSTTGASLQVSRADSAPEDHSQTLPFPPPGYASSLYTPLFFLYLGEEKMGAPRGLGLLGFLLCCWESWLCPAV